jgi:adenine-specific DNA-methyltransferase
VVSSPPYNIGKSYEKKSALQSYLDWQERILDQIIPRLKDTGSLCWQVGNFVDNGHIQPLDIEMAYIFIKHGLKLRNRIIWHFGHGLHNKRRFSGRYEVVMWYSKTDDYFFDVDPVRIPSKYPGKRHFKGPKKGELSGNPLGKNPEDVWDIPNVKSNHIEKTDHPCQFPVGLIERLVLSMTKPGDLVFDPFSGVGSAGVAAAIHKRHFWGCELLADYAKQGKQRIDDALDGAAQYRPHDREVYDHTQSSLSRLVERSAYESTKK